MGAGWATFAGEIGDNREHAHHDGGFPDVQSLAPLPVPLGSIDFLVATRCT